MLCTIKKQSCHAERSEVSGVNISDMLSRPAIAGSIRCAQDDEQLVNINICKP
jgi:hypothetical protein